MAIYHLSAQVISRSTGRSAVAAAAYRATERLADQRTGLVHDFSRRREQAETHILAPEGAPEWVRDRSRLWNEVEAAERRKDSQVAREINLALPRELNPDQQRQLLLDYVREQFVDRGMVADIAIHRANPENPHAHMMLTMRTIGPDGFLAKNREWNRPEVLEQWRERWADHANRALERERLPDRIDHRSLEVQGITDREPQVHEGPHVRTLEQRGIETERGQYNREVQERNAVVIDLEKARAERQALLQEMQVLNRLDDRVRHGWPLQPARDMADLERAAGGRGVTEQEIFDRRRQLWEQISGVHEQIRAIDSERADLDMARLRLSGLREANRELRTHRTPWAVARQWVNPAARIERKYAEERVRWARENVQRSPVRNEAELAAGQARLAARQAELPKLNSRLESLGQGYNLLGSILQAFQRDIRRQRERDEYERDMARRRAERSRDSGRERERER